MAMAPTMAGRAAEIFLIMLLPRVAAATPAHAAALTHSGRERPPARDGVRHSPASLPRARRFHMAPLLLIFSDTERGGANTRVRIYRRRDRKSTRLNSSHGYISYAVFCLKKKTNLIYPPHSP